LILALNAANWTMGMILGTTTTPCLFVGDARVLLQKFALSNRKLCSLGRDTTLLGVLRVGKSLGACMLLLQRRRRRRRRGRHSAIL
jgi:hypothetical protein